jgi:hypothetical protein
MQPSNKIQQARINEACQKVFKEYPDIVMAAGEGANVSFRFLADQLFPILGEDTPMEDIYDALFGQVALAKAGYCPGDPAAEKYRAMALASFKLGVECGKNVRSNLKKTSPRHPVENFDTIIDDIRLLPKVAIAGTNYACLPVVEARGAIVPAADFIASVGGAVLSNRVMPTGNAVVDDYIKASLKHEK